ncbi:MAG: TetR/AcrR family transcriptional regulator [Myxococcota bacterium]
MNQEERRSESRKKIMDAAREIFFREDFMGANLDEVAREAGLSKGSIYRYFNNKAGLYLSVVGETGREYTAALTEVVERDPQAHVLNRMRAISRFQLDYWGRHPDHLRVFWALDNESVIGDLPVEMVESVERAWRRNLAIGQRVLDEGVERGELLAVDTWNLIHTIWVLQTSLIEQDTTRIRRRVRGRSLEDAFFGAVEILVRGALNPTHPLPEGEGAEAVLAKP